MNASPQPDLPLSIEPVLGWRVWRLERREGELTLVAVTFDEPWPAGEAIHARCRRSMGHTAPQLACTCGVYATASPKDLARASVYSKTTSVVGAVAMWGTVVEHARGVRAASAYPARLALVCAPCLAGGRRGTPIVVASVGGVLVGLCRRHGLRHASCVSAPVAEIQAELLDTYGVELLPASRIVARARVPINGRGMLLGFASFAAHLIGFLLFLWVGLVALGVVFIGVGAVGAALFGGPNDDAPTPLTTVAPTPVTSSVAVSPLRGIGPAHRAVPAAVTTVPDFMIVCGVGQGHTVTLVPCAEASSHLIGVAQREPPNGAADDCFGDVAAYSRGAHYWVCWSAIGDGVDVRPWAYTPNPFTTTPSQGGSPDEHR